MADITTPHLLEIKEITKSFGGLVALDHLDLTLSAGEKIALIGPNGAGKTTLFNVVCGLLAPCSGSIRFKNEDIVGMPPHLIANKGISRSFQLLRIVRNVSVLENVLLAFPGQRGERASSLFFTPRLVCREETEFKLRAIDLLSRVGLENKTTQLAGSLSFGEQKLLQFMRSVAQGAELILLDEPIAGVNPHLLEVIATQISALAAEKRTVLLIEHNLELVSRVCQRAVFLSAGRKICEGTFDEVKNDPRVIDAYLA